MKKLMVFSGLLLWAAACHRAPDYDASGTFEAVEVIVSSEADGKLLRFDLEEGQRLQAGQAVGLVDTLQLHLRKAQLESSWGSVATRRLDIGLQIAATNEQIWAQQREKRRMENLIAANAGTKKQLDDIDSNIAVLQKQLAAQRSQLSSNNQSLTEELAGVEAQIEQLADLIEKSVVRSPIDGTVLVKYAEQGEMTATGKPLFKIAELDRLTLRAYITAGQMNQLQIGQQVRVFTDSGDKGRKEYTGTVTWISGQAEFTPKTIQTRDERANLVYAVKITVPNDGLIKIGMYGDILWN